MALLGARGVQVVGPDEGAMACNEYGSRADVGEPPAIVAAIEAMLAPGRARWRASMRFVTERADA